LKRKNIMCGIAGILQLDRSRLAPREVLERMLTTIFHRGPDEDGRLIDGELAMGMRRLSIIDLKDGQQPIFNESNRYAVIFNGEIYNYRELRTELIQRGHVLRTHSDTEVIVHLYEEHGPKCLEFLRGMFGIAVWDAQERTLFVARDRLGIKPLYYTEVDGSWLFGSEIKSLLQYPSLRADVDFGALLEYVSLKYTAAPRTLFRGIKSLLPGHYVLIRDGQVSTHCYWDVSYAKPSEQKTPEEYADALEEVLTESVRLRLRSDVPFGAFLSGGVDSSLIVALMSKQMQEPVKTFTVGFEEAEGQDELPYAKLVADRFGCEHHTLKIRAEHFLDLADKVLWHLDQPIADQATVATYMVSSLARQHVKMVLTGEGGDELFAGYARYRGEQYSKWFQHLPNWFGRQLRNGVQRLPGLRRARIALGALTIHDEASRYANWFPMFTEDAQVELLQSPIADGRGQATALFRSMLGRTDARHPLDRMLYCDTKAWLPDYLLIRGDKLTMANSLEARVPLLDHRLVEFAATVPPELKLHRNTGKWLLKQVAKRHLPIEIIERRKQGFPIPIERWLRAEARPLMRDLLATETLERRGYFHAPYVQKLMQQHEAGFADHSTQLWGLMSLEMWLLRFVDSDCVTDAADNLEKTT
jgi:asparagine synthase (glutamine-hydrolysing)